MHKGRDWLCMLYPKRCPVCQKIIKSTQMACEDCHKRLPYIREPRCRKCGKTIENEIQEYCFDCTKKLHAYDKGVALWQYNKELKASIHRFKYKNKREYVQFYAQEMLLAYENWIKELDVDVMIPVPIHSSKMRIRGFNQAELLANEMSKALNIPVDKKIVKRIQKTKAQNALNEKERKNNVNKAFKITQNGVKLKKVLIVDDIYTTGSTIDAIARILKETGVEKVYFCCICSGHGY